MNYMNPGKGLGVLGRIYLAREGVNAQLSVPESNFEEFVELVHANPFFTDMTFKRCGGRRW